MGLSWQSKTRRTHSVTAGVKLIGFSGMGLLGASRGNDAYEVAPNAQSRLGDLLLSAHSVPSRPSLSCAPGRAHVQARGLLASSAMLFAKSRRRLGPGSRGRGARMRVLRGRGQHQAPRRALLRHTRASGYPVRSGAQQQKSAYHHCLCPVSPSCGHGLSMAEQSNS